MGESAPYDDFSWTDGICLSCKAEIKSKKVIDLSAMNHKIEFFRDLRIKAFKGEIINHIAMLKQAEQLHIQPGDVLIGVLQPILCEIGNLFEQGKISTIEEHRFSILAEKVLSHFEEKYLQALATSNPCVILASADQNYHTIGVRILSLLLMAEGIRVMSIVPSVPAQDLARLCEETNPKVLGISIFAESQIDYVNSVLKLLSKNRPDLITVGGYYFKDKVIELDQNIYVPNPRDIKEVVSRFKSVCVTPANNKLA